MEFDKAKVFTVLNADEIKADSKGYFADTIKDLKDVVQNECSKFYGEIKEIKNEKYCNRFYKKDGYSYSYNLFYLVEEPKENRFRPYSNPDEMIEDFVKRYSQYNGFKGNANPMYNPMIWIKSKSTGFRHLVTDYGDNSYDCNCVWIGAFSIVFKELLDDYTYLDGSPCGIEE